MSLRKRSWECWKNWTPSKAAAITAFEIDYDPASQARGFIQVNKVLHFAGKRSKRDSCCFGPGIFVRQRMLS
jgi:hypothetical protein